MFPRVPSRSPPRYRYMYPPCGNSLFNSEPGCHHTQHTRGSLTLPRLPELDTFFNKDAEAFRSRHAPSEDSLPDPSNIFEEVYTLRTVSYGLQAVTPVARVKLSSDEEVQFPDPEPITQPVSIKRGRGRPKKAPVAASHSEIIPVVPSFTFELLVMNQTPTAWSLILTSLSLSWDQSVSAPLSRSALSLRLVAPPPRPT
ncbi:hypothetical protein EV359DRAFT_87882 [Lentinula novae-zelandiae]|nr:hypothetical protein EV359DRAFT_87882 [Lentinula novae-zelandiae]